MLTVLTNIRSTKVSEWCFKAFFVQMPGSPHDDPAVRLASNLKPVNKAVDKVDTPWTAPVIYEKIGFWGDVLWGDRSCAGVSPSASGI